MANLRTTLQAKIHEWMNKVGFRLNSSEIVKKKGVKVDHYFFETFNFTEQYRMDKSAKVEFVCFDAYGEKVVVRSLLDLQSAFFENLSQLK